MSEARRKAEVFPSPFNRETEEIKYKKAYLLRKLDKIIYIFVVLLKNKKRPQQGGQQDVQESRLR